MDYKKILCLDGGGVRGRYSLGICHLLSASMLPAKISSMFDLIVSVSVGAFVGAIIALGFFDEEPLIHTKYQELLHQLPDIMRSKNKFGPAILEPRYDGTGKKNVLERIFGSKKLGDCVTNFVVVTSTIGGKVKLFKSWDVDDAKVSLVDILDATSAVPCIFPPVLIGKQYLIDGGIVNNKPVLIALCCSIDLFGPENPIETLKKLKMMSIGTHSLAELQIEADLPNQMGLVTWLGLGLFDILTGVPDDSSINLLKMLLGPNRFMRIHCECGRIKLDDLSSSAMRTLDDAIVNSWKREGTTMRRFLLENKTYTL